MAASSVQKYSIKKFRAEGQFLRLLFLWKGSLYKMVWIEVLVWIVCYYFFNLTYRFFLNDEQKRQFESMVVDFDHGISFVPLSFVLGFYVAVVVRRYWKMWENLPWPHTIAMRISSTINGQGIKGQQVKRTAMRHINLALLLAFRKLSQPVMEKYPSLDSIVDKGLLMKDEKELLENSGAKTPPFWLPLFWVAAMFNKARQEERIHNDYALAQLMDDLSSFRKACGRSLQVDLVSIPLAYSQVVIIACYTFFLGSIIARQAVEADIGGENYVPIFTILQVAVFIGWLSVAECMVHPFGDDDDDFQLNWLIDRNIEVTYQIIDSGSDFADPLVQPSPEFDDTSSDSPSANIPSSNETENQPLQREWHEIRVEPCPQQHDNASLKSTSDRSNDSNGDQISSEADNGKLTPTDTTGRPMAAKYRRSSATHDRAESPPLLNKSMTISMIMAAAENEQTNSEMPPVEGLSLSMGSRKMCNDEVNMFFKDHQSINAQEDVMEVGRTLIADHGDEIAEGSHVTEVTNEVESRYAQEPALDS